MRLRLKILLIVAGVLAYGTAGAQKYPERKLIRSGIKSYQRGNYTDSQIKFGEALGKDTTSYEARFNLGNSAYKQERFDEATSYFDALTKDSTNMNLPAAYYNLGNSLFGQKKYQEAAEAYKNSLRLNPGDVDAKFNLAYAKKMIDDKKDDQDKDKDKDKNKDKDKDKNQDKEKSNNKDNDQDGQQPPPRPEGAMTREEAERMLESMQQNEDKTREKMDKDKGTPIPGAQNW